MKPGSEFDIPPVYEIDTRHWLSGVRHCPSPNHNERPAGEIALIVVHGISLPPGHYGGPHIEHLFCNALDPEQHPYFATVASLQVSAHVLIRREGELVQFVPFDRRAWHAGVSQWQGRANCNDFSIGIELEGTDTEPYERVQYQQLATLIRALRQRYPGLGEQGLVGHSDIAPGRKTDPGPAFDWAELQRCLCQSPGDDGEQGGWLS